MVVKHINPLFMLVEPQGDGPNQTPTVYSCSNQSILDSQPFIYSTYNPRVTVSSLLYGCLGQRLVSS